MSNVPDGFDRPGPWNLAIMAVGRRAGKTTASIEWVLRGVRTRTYPGWTRVLVLPSRSIFDFTRGRYWGEIEDFDHRVYDLHTWQRARGIDPDTEVRVDEANFLFDRLPGRLTGLTFTGYTWSPDDAPEPSDRTGVPARAEYRVSGPRGRGGGADPGGSGGPLRQGQRDAAGDG